MIKSLNYNLYNLLDCDDNYSLIYVYDATEEVLRIINCCKAALERRIILNRAYSNRTETIRSETQSA